MLFLTLIVWVPSYILSLYLVFLKAEQLLLHGVYARTNVSETSPPGNNAGGWLARLGWGLGEASVEIIDSKPAQVFEARIAFFGRAIPEDGLTGWLVPLDSIVEPCTPNEENVITTLNNPEPTASIRGSRTPPMPFMGLDGAYELEIEYEYDDSNDPTIDPDNTGCPPLCPITSLFGHSTNGASTDEGEPFTPFPNTTWIALVQRGTCSFAAKAQYAQSIGASGLIVGGLDNNLISMSASGATGAKIEIASIFVGHNSYLNLTAAVERSGVRIGVGSPASTSDHSEGEKEVRVREVRTIMVRLEGEPPWEWYTPILSLLLVLSLPSLLTLCTLLVHRVRAERREREMRAPEDIVAGLPIRVWTGAGWEKDLESGRQAIPSVHATEEDEVGDSTQPSERSPLLPVRSDLKESGGASGYGAIDPEPSTSAPQRQDIPHLEDDTQGRKFHPSIHPALAPEPLSPSEERDLTLPISGRALSGSQGTRHRQEESDETIPRPPWFASQTECAICICEFEVGDRVRVLPCGHIFHKDEVDPWLIKQRKVCPVCKYDVTNPPTAHVPASTSPLTSALVSAAAAEEEPPSPAATDTGVAPSMYSHASGHRSVNDGGSMAPSRTGGQVSGGTDVTAAQLLARLDDGNARPGLFARWRAWVNRNDSRSRTDAETEQANPT